MPAGPLDVACSPRVCVWKRWPTLKCTRREQAVENYVFKSKGQVCVQLFLLKQQLLIFICFNQHCFAKLVSLNEILCFQEVAMSLWKYKNWETVCTNVITTPFFLENTSSPLLGVAMPFPAGKGAYRPLYSLISITHHLERTHWNPF